MTTSHAHKTILITGGTGALGSALVRLARESGATVYFTFSQNVDRAEELAKNGGHAIQCDMANDNARHDCVAYLEKRAPKLDAVIFNAAAVADHIIQNMTEAEWDHVIAVDFTGIRQLAAALKPLLSAAARRDSSGAYTHYAKLITLISRVGLSGAFGQANYASAKDALIELTKCLAIEYAPDGITVNGVNPGFMPSAMTDSIPEDMKQRHKDTSILNTYSDPDEVARFILYLCSDNCQRVSGQIFHYETRIISG